MSARKALRSVLWNFLGTYMSRYSDFNGYWRFGFLLPELDSLEIDLLSSHVTATTPSEAAAQLAEAKFADQVEKAGLDKSRLSSARLRITRSPEMTRCNVRAVTSFGERYLERRGFTVRFTAESQLCDGHSCVVERAVFIAPHDPHVEARSSRHA